MRLKTKEENKYMINWRKSFKKILRKSVSLLTVLSVIFSSLGPAAIAPVNAANITTGAVVNNFIAVGQTIKASSNAKALFGYNLANGTARTLDAARIIIAGPSGFNPSTDLAALANDGTSGIALYKDGAVAGEDGAFNPGSNGDAVVTLSSAVSVPAFNTSVRLAQLTPATTALYTINGSSNTISPALAVGDMVYKHIGMGLGAWGVVTTALSATELSINGSAVSNGAYSISKFGGGAGNTASFTTGAGGANPWTGITGTYTSPTAGDAVLYQTGTNPAIWGVVTAGGTQNQDTLAINGSVLPPTTSYVMTKISSYAPATSAVDGATAGLLTNGLNFALGDLVIGTTGSGYIWGVVTTAENVAVGGTVSLLRLNDGSSAPLFSVGTRVSKITASGTSLITASTPVLAAGDVAFTNARLNAGVYDYNWHAVMTGGNGGADSALRIDGYGSSPYWPWSITLTPAAGVAIPADDTTAGNVGADVYVAAKTGGSATNDKRFAAIFVGNSDLTISAPDTVSIGSLPVVTSDITIDTVGPTISTVEQINPNAVEVAFSDPVQTSTATNGANYTFSGGLTVIDSVQQGPNYRIVASGNITPGTTTLTVGAGVLDLAGNANTETTAQAISVPVKVRISEVAPEIGSATSEFVELYNGGGNSVDISGWKLQYSAANPVIWTDIATIPGSTNLAQFKFYLISTIDFDSTPAVNGDTSIAAGLALASGHLRLMNGTTEIDKVGWGTATSPEGTAIGAPAANQSLERKAFGSSSAIAMATGGMDITKGNSWDTNNNSFDFVIQTAPSPQNLAAAAEDPQAGGGGGGGMGPMINHMPISNAPTGADLSVVAQMGDPATPIDQMSAELHYVIGDGTFSNNLKTAYTTVLGEHQSNGYFKFTVPQATVDGSTANGLYYYLKLITNGGTRFMSANPAVDMGSYGSADLQEVDIAKNPFVTNVAAAGTARTIQGTITNGSSALVFLEGTGYSATADGSGVYSITAQDGIYNLVIAKNGYFEEWVNNILLNSGNSSLTVNKTLNAGQGGGMTGDNTKPFVTWTGPNDGMMGIPALVPEFKVFMGFSRDLDGTTFNSSNVYLTLDGTTPIVSGGAGAVYDNVPGDNVNMPPDPYLGIVNPPTGGFLANKTYYLVMTGNIRDIAGNSLSGNRPEGGHVISFTTGLDSGSMNFGNFGSGAMMPPFVMGTIPYSGANNAVPNTKITINFSDPMDSVSVNSTNIKLYKITVSGTVEGKENIPLSSVALDTPKQNATLTPSGNLTSGKYRISVSGALKSATGIWMGNPGSSPPQNTASYEFFKSEFEVPAGAVADATVPTILGTWPADNATGVAVNPGSLNIQFSEGMDPATINSNNITFKRGSTAVTGSVSYDPMGQSASFVPSVVLATSTVYTLTVTTGVTDSVGNAIAENIITFTTSATGDTTAPIASFANGDDFSVAITFSEPMNSANITDSTNWGKSVLNLANYVIKWGPNATVVASGTPIVLTDANFKYDGATNTVVIENLGLTPGSVIGQDYYVNMNPANVADGVADLSGNLIAVTMTAQTPIKDSMQTKGMLGPMVGGMTGGMMGPSMGDMGMMKAGVFPMNAMAGQTTVYFVDIPTTSAIANNYKIVLTFPTGFDVSGAKKDAFSPVNNDINEWNTGVVSFSTEAETSGGANNDGVTADSASRTITIDLAVTGTAPVNDFLHLDLAGIVNSSIPKGFDTSGYSVDMKIKDGSGTLSESVAGMPFFINEGGSNSLVVTVNGVTSGDNGDISVFLGSPMTGPMEKIVNFTAETSDIATFSSLPAGQYMLFTEPTVTLGANDYAGMPMPQSITINGANTKIITLSKQGAGSGAAITVNVTGAFGTDDIDIFAGSPTGFRVKTLTDAGNNPSGILYLPAGNWMVGIGPAMPKGPMSGPPPMPDWMPPMPSQVTSDGATPQTVNISIATATMQIIGYVQDGAGNPIADAEAFAYQPMGTGTGAHGKTDTNGKFTLKVSSAGIYSVGVFKPGLPGVPDRTVKVEANTGAVDGNSTANVTVDGTLITAANQFIFKIQKSSTTISGKVTNGTDPVSFAPVWAFQTGSTGHVDTMTDSAGNYILYVGNGTWTVQSYVPGYGDSTAQTVVVNGSSMTQNLEPATSAALFKTISGTVTINGVLQTFMPIRAVQYNGNAVYTGKEFGGQTDASGAYKISVPIGLYRVDIWTPQYGEVELSTDGVANSPANINVTDNIAGANITIAGASLNTVTLAFTNGMVSQSAIIDIDGVTGNPPKPTGFHKTIKLATLAASSNVLLADGNYMFKMSVAGLGEFAPSTNPASISSNGTVTFVLPVSAGAGQDIFSVSGIVVDGANPISGAWVWIGNPTTGVHFGTTTANNGTYSLNVKSGTYKMGVEMPGFVPQAPTDIIVSADAPNTNYGITLANQFITGRIFADTVAANSAYDAGEAVANGWVWVEETTTKKIAGAPTDLDGIFSMGVGNGTYILRGTAEGYSETKYASLITTSGAGSTGNNIKLTADANWSSKLKSKPMTPASGGTMDDSLSTGTGIKLVVPPNALGSGTSSGNIKTNEISSVSKTSSAQPLGSKGKEITAQDNSGQAITTLNDDIEVELNYYKADIVEADVQDMGKIDMLTNSYWDSSVSDWVPMSTTKKAYTKAVGNEAEWTAQSDFSVFVDALEANADAYGDYKISLQSTSSHLTIFGATIPSDLTAPAAPSSLVQTSGNGTSVVLDWANNSEADLLEYEVYRSASASVAAINANQKNSSQLLTSAFTDSTTSAWTSYYYTITAVDDSGNESAVAAEARMCSNKTVLNGTVANTCVITCDTGYTLSGNSCAADAPAATPVPSSGGGSYIPPATTVTGGSVSIANGAVSTTTTAVTLTLAATNAATMAISNVSDFAGAAWEIYTTSKAWILSAGDGLKTVYAKFRDAAGVASSAVSDTITLGNVLTPAPAPASFSTSYPDGTLLKSSDAPEVYVIKSGNKVWVKTAEEFNAAGYKWGDIKVVSGEVLKAVGSVRLIRIDGDSRVYVLHDNKKTHIKTAEEFNAAGYKWENIILVSQAEANLYADGAAAIGKTIIITPLWLRVRALNTTNSAELGRVNKGENYSVLEENNNWFKIQTAKGIIGWVSGAYATLKTASAVVSGSETNIVISVPTLRVRNANSIAGKILGAVKKGTVLSVLEENNGWYKITTTGGIIGWVLGSYVTKQ